MARSLYLSLTLVCALALPASALAKTDFSAQAWNILPPGEAGVLPAVPNSTDQLALYDALTPLGGNVTADDITKYFKPATFGVTGPVVSTEHPKRGVTIVRDTFGVPHITGKTRADVFFGAGWAVARDRGLFLEVIRYPGRIAALDVPHQDALKVASSLRRFTPSRQAERFLAAEGKAFAQRPGGKQVIADAKSYIAGINAEYRKTKAIAKPWTLNDVVAVTALLGNVFGRGGGMEVQSSQLLAGLQAKLGQHQGFAVWKDLRSMGDPEAPATTTTPFPYDTPPSTIGPGAKIVDPAPATASAAMADPEPGRRDMSNALLVGASESATGHPLFVAGPQLGYYYPEFFAELDLHGGGIDVRGGALPGEPYVLIGRGEDYAWSATSADSDNTDEFLEELCGKNKYRYKGKCIRMQRFDAGVVRAPTEHLVYMQTVHGPVVGEATVGGKKYAVSYDRSTRGRDIFSAPPIAALNSNRVASAKDFVRTVNGIEFTFNLFYADNRDIAFLSAGRLPIRAKGTYPGLPTVGTGQYDWKGFLPLKAHPQAISPASGLILNWNNKPAPGFSASDSNYAYGSLQRVVEFTGFGAKNTLADVVSIMNRAAVEDLRVVRVWPEIQAVLATGPAPDALTQQAADIVTAWGANGGTRLDRDLDGKIDNPGAAILDAAWPRITDAVLSPVIGDLTSQLAVMMSRDDPPADGGSAYSHGWFGYVDKDLRSLLGRPVNGPYSRRYCGGGDLNACRDSLWAAIQEAANELAQAQGPDPTQWHADANAERIKFTPGILGHTMRWTNRPTFQQVMEFSGHRPRR
jgi:acyl-homoserine lactone acylase PvdQ